MSVSATLRAQAATLIALADALDTTNQAPAPAAAPTAAPAPVKRGRGRPVAGEAPAAPAPAPAVVAQPEPADPFDTAPVAPVVTQDEVRTALSALRAVTTQDNAVAVLKAVGGVSSLPELPPDKYAAVKAAVEEAIKVKPELAAAPVEVDPFATVGAAPIAAPAEVVAPTIEQVKAAITTAGKKTSESTLMRIVMDHGGKVASPQTPGGFGPSLRALPADKYAAVIAAINAIPNTKG